MRRPSVASWCTNPQSVRTRKRRSASPSRARSRVTPSRIRKWTFPALGASSAHSNRNRVDLPDPDSPTTAITSPSYSPKDTSRHPSCRPYHLDRPSAISSGASSSFTAALRNGRLIIAALLAIVGVRTNKDTSAAVVGDHFIEEAVRSPAEGAGAVGAVALEWMILEIERDHLRVRRDRIDALFSPGTEQLQSGAVIHFRIIELGCR